MCGIAGVWNRDPRQEVPLDVLQQMGAVLHHRGPDDRGEWRGGGGGLAATRLSIVDLAGGHQPLTNEDGRIAAALNGEIYNHESLRRQLEAAGHVFRSRVDTEVLVHGYEAWGARGLSERLEGMFAGAVYDRKAHRLVLVRDRLGVKPLYLAQVDAGVVFGSELKAVLQHPAVPRRLDAEGVDLFLTFEFIPAPRTLLQDVRKLEPGRVFIVDPGGARQERYWRLPPPSDGAGPAEDEAAERVGELIERSVQDRLMADVPLGALLSGGVDSSSVVSRMAALGVKPLRTFSIGFREPTYDESRHAEEVATFFGTDHHAAGIVPRAVDLVTRLMPFLDDPIGDFSVFPTYLVSGLARQHVKVVLSGDGGDELFGGYDTYLADRFAPPAWLLAGVVRRVAFGLGRWMRPREAKKGAWNLARRFLEGLGHEPGLGHLRWMVFLGGPDKARGYGPWLRENLREFDLLSVVDSALDGKIVRDPVERGSRLDLGLYLPENILLKVDRMSMACSLEARVPLLDHRLVEYVAGLPGRFKIRRGERKWILRRAVRDWLPTGVLDRKKSGFSIPMKTWLRDDLQHLTASLSSGPLVRDHGLMEERFLARLVDDHLAGRADHAHRLWPLIVLEAWVKEVLHGDAWAGTGVAPNGGARRAERGAGQ